jgi:hypothetical protein
VFIDSIEKWKRALPDSLLTVQLEQVVVVVVVVV